jgi:tRNA A37 threonylcarbamoyladenosine synthetase subunit TsaC/SUA5/YrdC
MSRRELNPEMAQEARDCVVALRKGSMASFPSPSGWCTVCDVTDESATKALLHSKVVSHHCVLLDHDGRLVRYYGQLSEPLLNLIEFSEKPLQFILKGASQAAKHLPSNLPFMIASDTFSNRVSSSYGKPLLAAFGQEPNTSIDNIPCHVVNLRTSMDANTDQIVVMQFNQDGSFQFIKK